jgi:hypothetical protein
LRSSLGLKRLKNEADHSLPYNSEVKNGGAIPPLPPPEKLRIQLIKYTQSFTISSFFFKFFGIKIKGAQFRNQNCNPYSAYYEEMLALIVLLPFIFLT